MNNTVQTIIEMDKAARLKVSNAKIQAQTLTENAEKKRIKLTKKYKEATETEAERICDGIKKASEAEIEKIRSDADEKCKRLEAAIKKSRASRISEITKRIFEGTE